MKSRTNWAAHLTQEMQLCEIPYLFNVDIDADCYESIKPDADMPEANMFTIDVYLQATVQLPKPDELQMATVLKRK
jgi:hypothetical protein